MGRENRTPRKENAMDARILYRDRDLLIACKPAGIPSQPDPSGQADLLTALQADHPSASLIHRLDTPTGGVMTFGLTTQATARLCTLVQDHSRFCKEYLAVLSARPAEEEGTLTDLLFHDKQKNKAYVTDRPRKGSKEAALDYKVLDSAPDGHTLVWVRLHTGRTHQIRVHMAHIGCPLHGDFLYGRVTEDGYFLRCDSVSFSNPHSGKKLTIKVDKTLDL
jgi:23S rRNA pseudouridine1911/1915/1917 synthase